MHWDRGRLTTRISIALGMLAGMVLAVVVLALLWRSAASASAAGERKLIGASTRLEVLESDVRALTDSNKATEESLASARTELKEWQNEFQSRVGSDVRRRLKAAKTEWVAIGFARGEKKGRAAGRKAGFAAGKEAGYDTGYSDGLVDALLESGGGANGGGSSGNCNPNYSGCLIATASDYDCAGGSGDGPYYTGPVEVLGYDEYDLDRDGDGFGCDS